MEVASCRYSGHSISDPSITYRTLEEIQNIRSTSDPIFHLKNVIVDFGVATEADLKKIDKQAKKTVDDAQKEAEQSPTVVHHYD